MVGGGASTQGREYKREKKRTNNNKCMPIGVHADGNGECGCAGGREMGE